MKASNPVSMSLFQKPVSDCLLSPGALDYRVYVLPLKKGLTACLKEASRPQTPSIDILVGLKKGNTLQLI
jgi:hypothetical protein